MKSSKILAGVAVALLNVALSTVAADQHEVASSPHPPRPLPRVVLEKLVKALSFFAWILEAYQVRA